MAFFLKKPKFWLFFKFTLIKVYYQKSLHLYDVPVRRNSIFRAEGGKFSTSILWRKKLRISIFSFSSPRTQFFSNLDFLLISPKKCLYLLCVKAEKFLWLLRVARAKTIWGCCLHHPPGKISWQATPREIRISSNQNQFLSSTILYFIWFRFINNKPEVWILHPGLARITW